MTVPDDRVVIVFTTQHYITGIRYCFSLVPAFFLDIQQNRRTTVVLQWMVVIALRKIWEHAAHKFGEVPSVWKHLAMLFIRCVADFGKRFPSVAQRDSRKRSDSFRIGTKKRLSPSAIHIATTVRRWRGGSPANCWRLWRKWRCSAFCVHWTVQWRWRAKRATHLSFAEEWKFKEGGRTFPICNQVTLIFAKMIWLSREKQSPFLPLPKYAEVPCPEAQRRGCLWDKSCLEHRVAVRKLGQMPYLHRECCVCLPKLAHTHVFIQ